MLLGINILYSNDKNYNYLYKYTKNIKNKAKITKLLNFNK